MIEELPYKTMSELDPLIPADALDLHYNGHHRTYYVNLRDLTIGTEYELNSCDESKCLEKILGAFWNSNTPIFNNASQVYLHNLFWRSLKPNNFVTEINNLLESYLGENFKEKIYVAAKAHFGSGWLFLIYKDNKIIIETKSNAQLPDGHILWVMDIWEHSYYLQFRNQKDKYIRMLLDGFINQSFIYERLKIINFTFAPEPTSAV